MFCSLPLLEELKRESRKAIGTLRNNRIQNCPLPSVKETEKKERGNYVAYSTKDLCVVRYNDNRAVTIASNYAKCMPLLQTNRRVKGQAEKIVVDQPSMIDTYNRHMGGVDLLDGYLSNLRPCIGGKKWYWAPLINCIRMLQVATFKTYVALGHPISHLDFMRMIVNEAANNCR